MTFEKGAFVAVSPFDSENLFWLARLSQPALGETQVLAQWLEQSGLFVVKVFVLESNVELQIGWD